MSTSTGPMEERVAESTKRALARIGTTLRGKYTLDGLLGEGGMAVVFSATHRNKKRFAVKMLYPEVSIYDDLRARFLKEGYVANTVAHPGVVQVLDDDVAEDGSAFLVMELLEGQTAGALAEGNDGRLDVRTVLTIAHELLDALSAAHEKGIVHRDLKPANIFITTEGTLKVLDFGIARIREAAKETGDSSTATGVMMGTPAYMPPEQAMGKSNEVDARTDLWAVGATMFNLMSGRNVHEGENPTLTMIASATQQARSISSLLPNLPHDIAFIVDKATAFDRALRWQTAKEMQEAIAKLHQEKFAEPVSDATLEELCRRTPIKKPHGGTVVIARTPANVTPVGSGDLPAPAAAPSSDDASGASGASAARRKVSTVVSPSTPLPATSSEFMDSTGVPVATSETTDASVFEQKPSGRKLWMFAPLLLLPLGLGVGAAALLVRPHVQDGASDLALPSTQPTAIGSAASAPSSALTLASVPSAPTQSVTSSPSVAPSAASAASVATVVTAVVPKKPPPQPSTSVPKKPSCDPPYWVDSSGKHYKPECFQ